MDLPLLVHAIDAEPPPPPPAGFKHQNPGCNCCDETITCHDIEFPAVLGVEVHGTVSGVPDVEDIEDAVTCALGAGGDATADVLFHVGDDLFPFFGELMEVQFYPDLSAAETCTWCPAETDDLPIGPTPPEPTNEDDIIDPCGEVLADTYCKGWLTFDTPDVGYEDVPGGPVVIIDGCCDPCDGLGSASRTWSYTATSGTPLLVSPQVGIETLGGGGLKVTVTVTIEVYPQVIVEDVYQQGCPAEYYCGEDGPYFDGFEQRTWTCGASAHIGPLVAVFERDFPLATSWEDIKNEEIPAVSGWAAEEPIVYPAVTPLDQCFLYDWLDCGESPPVGEGLYRAANYSGLHAVVSDAYVVLREL